MRRLGTWVVIVLSFTAFVTEGVLMQAGKAEILIGILACVLLIAAVVFGWLALFPKNLEVKFPEFSLRVGRIAVLCFAVGILAVGAATGIAYLAR